MKIQFTVFFLRRLTLLLLLLIGMILSTNAQNKIAVEAKASKEKIELRWAPTDIDTWYAGMKYGYHIYRIKVKEGGKLATSTEAFQLTDQPVKIANKDLWQSSKDTSSAFQLATIALFGDFQSTMGSSAAKSLKEQYQIQEGRFAYSLLAADMSLEVAVMSGLYFTDSIVDPNATYFYTIQVANGNKLTTLKGSKLIGQKFDNEYFTDTIRSVKTSVYEHNVLFTWDKNSREGLNYTQYAVFRSDRIKGEYKRVNEFPILPINNDGKVLDSTLMYFKDSVPKLNTKYYYKIAGKNLFQDWSPLSEPIEVIGFDRLEALDFEFAAERIDNKEVNLTWKENPEQGIITSYDVLRSNSNFGKYEKINEKPLKQSERIFVDKKPLRNNYYILLVHTENESHQSMPRFIHMIDKDPPKAPVGLKAVVDSTGIVTVSWSRNKESDIEGYTVFKGSYLESEYSNISRNTIVDTFFVDTLELKTLSKNAYFKVIALDDSHNPSEMSLPLTVKLTDIIPPTSPLISKVKSSTEGIHLEWKNSSSEDLQKQILYREKDKGFLEEIKVFEGESLTQTSFVDTTAKLDVEYVYTMVAIDDSGLRSKPSNKVEMERQRITVRPAMQNWTVIVNKKNHQAKLTWELKDQNIEAFVIYRQTTGYNMSFYARVDGSLGEYFDDLRKADTDYTYKIRAIYLDGSSTILSDSKTIHY